MRGPVVLSFALELLLLLLLVTEQSWPLLAIVNGCYSCLYWTIQRVLFLAGGTADNSGRRFGNFQIFVLLVLKIGILIGGYLLEKHGLPAVCVLSVVTAVLAVMMFFRVSAGLNFPIALQEQPTLYPAAILSFKDKYNSRLIFGLDGVFLYLESYFWVISLFIITGESFVRLGGVVIALALVLALAFYLIKNSIDSLNVQMVYVAGVVLYIFSWFFRGALEVWEMLDNTTLEVCAVLAIAFATAFFRLAFNKRFFDLAARTSYHNYIFVKSYYSQIVLGAAFILFGTLVGEGNYHVILQNCYFGAGILAAVYFFYRNGTARL